jgi:hypothetical protein
MLTTSGGNFLMLRKSGLIAAAALAATSIWADGILPPPQYFVNGVDQGAPGFYSLQSGSGASINFSGSPLASVTVTANGSPDLNLNSPTGDLRYFFEFTSLDGTPTPIPLLVGTTVFASFVEPPGGSGNDFPLAKATLKIAGVLQQDETAFGTDTEIFNGTLSASIMSDTMYQVDLIAHVNTLGAETGTAYVDPQYFLDPGLIDPNGFNLILSDGIGNASAAAPEPGSIGLVLLGTAGCILTHRRRSRARRDSQASR